MQITDKFRSTCGIFPSYSEWEIVTGKGSKHVRPEQAGNRVHEVEEINPDPHDGDISTPTTL